MTKDDAKELRFIAIELAERDELGAIVAEVSLYDDGSIVIDWTGGQGPEWGWPIEDAVKVADAIKELASGGGKESPEVPRYRLLKASSSEA